MTRHPTIKVDKLALLLLDDDGVRAARRHNGEVVEFPVDELLPDMEKAQLGCPLCGRTDSLYENVSISGWIAVNGHRFEDDGAKVRPTSPATTSSGVDREADWDSVDHENYACSYCCDTGTYLERLALVVPPKPGGTAGS